MRTLIYLLTALLTLGILFLINPVIFLWTLVGLLCAAKYLIITKGIKKNKK